MLLYTYPISIIGIVITLILSQSIPVCTPTFFMKLKNSKHTEFDWLLQYLIPAPSNYSPIRNINVIHFWIEFDTFWKCMNSQNLNFAGRSGTALVGNSSLHLLRIPHYFY